MLTPSLVGLRIRAALALAGLAEREAALRLGLPEEALRTCLLGQREVPRELLDRLAIMTGVGLPFFTDGAVDVAALQAALDEGAQAVRELVQLLRVPASGNPIGAAILQSRVRRNWTQAELSARSRATRSTVAAWECGRARPSPARWMALVELMPELALVARVANGHVVLLENSAQGDRVART